MIEQVIVDMDGKWIVAGADNVVSTPDGDGTAKEVVEGGLLVRIPGKGTKGPYGSHQLTNLGYKSAFKTEVGVPERREGGARTEQCEWVLPTAPSGVVNCLHQKGHKGQHSFEKPIIHHVSGKVSTSIPPFHLIPHPSIIALANRFDRGVRIKGDGAWNATSPNQDAVMKDKAFLIDRLGHGIDHCYKAIARLTGNATPLDEEEMRDGGDAGAIMFAGALLAAVEDWERRDEIKPGEGS